MTSKKPQQVYAVVIGISLYSTQPVALLPAATKDALRFARSIRFWGVPESNIYLLLDSNASRKELDKILALIENKKDKHQFIFYFCGHGYRTEDEIPESYLILQDGEVHLDYLIDRICSFSASDSYVIIDACKLRLNNIINPKLVEELNGRRESDKSLLCLLSSGIEQSYENSDYGYFTEALLNGLSTLRLSECSPSELVKFIQLELMGEKLPLPEVYNIGNQNITIAQHLPEQNGVIYRHERIAKIQDGLTQNRSKILCLVGPSGSGKTFLCSSLASEKLRVFYTTDIDDNRIFDPGSLIIIDQLERLNPQQLNALFGQILKTKNQFLLISNYSIKTLLKERFQPFLTEIEHSLFTYEEGYDFIKLIHPAISEKEYELYYLLSNGNPSKMRMLACIEPCSEDLEPNSFSQEVKRAISAIFSSGFYVNEPLFVKHFNLQETALSFLEEMGLIIQSEKGWIPQHLLYELAEAENLVINGRSTLDYWYEQIDQLPDHIYACHALILAVKSLGYEEKGDDSLKLAFYTLYRKGKTELEGLLDGFDIFMSFSKITKACLQLIDIFLDWGYFDLSERLLSLTSHSPKIDSEVALRKIQLQWRTGRIEESIVSCTDFIRSSRIVSSLIKAYFHRGLGYFMNGDWDKARLDFMIVHDNSEDIQLSARAQCMVGTIVGMKGTNMSLGREYLEDGIRKLLRINDLSGAWSGWNNLGEMLWKCGDYRSSAFYLEKALKLSKHPSERLETLRNMLQLQLRIAGPFSTQVTALINEIESLDWNLSSTFDLCQLLNTLVTAYIFRRNLNPVFPFLKLLITFSLNNKEIHIFTLSNLSLLSKVLLINQKSEKFFLKAVECATEIGNMLAVHQFKNDHKLCFRGP